MIFGIENRRQKDGKATPLWQHTDACDAFTIFRFRVLEFRSDHVAEG